MLFVFITAYTSCIARENASHVNVIAPLERFRTKSRILLSGRLALLKNVTALSTLIMPDFVASNVLKCFSYFARSLSVIGLAEAEVVGVDKTPPFVDPSVPRIEEEL